jgi:hypothetical protein
LHRDKSLSTNPVKSPALSIADHFRIVKSARFSGRKRRSVAVLGRELAGSDGLGRKSA